MTIVCLKTSKPGQRVTTILGCHLRWKGEEDWNPCACILVTRFVGRSQSLTAGATGEINNNPRYYHREHGKEKYVEALP